MVVIDIYTQKSRRAGVFAGQEWNTNAADPMFFFVFFFLCDKAPFFLWSYEIKTKVRHEFHVWFVFSEWVSNGHWSNGTEHAKGPFFDPAAVFYIFSQWLICDLKGLLGRLSEPYRCHEHLDAAHLQEATSGIWSQGRGSTLKNCFSLNNFASGSTNDTLSDEFCETTILDKQKEKHSTSEEWSENFSKIELSYVIVAVLSTVNCKL